MSVKQLTFFLADNIGNELSFVTNANIIESPKVKIITFVEQTDLGLQTKLIIYNDHIEMYRTGLISMSQDFNLNKITYTIIKSSYGAEIKMDNKTLSLKQTDNDIYITYQTSVDAGKGIIHTLKIKWEK